MDLVWLFLMRAPAYAVSIEMKNYPMKTRLPYHTELGLALQLAMMLFLLLGGGGRLAAAETVTEKVGAAASEAGEKLQEAGAAAKSGLESLWERIDAQRLKNRTPDQIVAWVIVGLLVGALLNQFNSRLNKWTNLLLGLAGAFLGGIVASLTGFDLGLGPVLIRYEELLFALAGGVVIALIGPRLFSRKQTKP